jgi:uncharacterized membrane protein YdjX (TVP38/TMEM64 family)
MMSAERRERAQAIGAAVVVAALVALGVLAWKLGWFERLRDVDALAEYLRRDGARGAWLCIGAQFLQVVIFFIPGEITQVAAGYVFGVWKGFAYSVIGIMSGSAFAYAVGVLVGRPAFEKIFGAVALDKLERVVRSDRGILGVFLLFLAPGAPKDAMSYGAGLAGVGFWRFLFVSGLGRMPALFFSTLFGSQAFERDWRSLAWSALVAVAVGGVFWVWRRRMVGA